MRDWIRKIISAPVKFYRLAISPLLGPACRFTPTCSAYMLEALERHGPVKGAFLGFRRILKCNPWSRACGHDPVPETFDWPLLIGYKRPSPRT